MKYFVETWEDCKELGKFNTQEERQKWINEKCYINDNGAFLKGTGERISIYEI